MKKFSSEFGHNYGSYSFGYASYCQKEKDDKLAEVYAHGYLPYSGSPNVKDVFYMSRSARVPLEEFKLTSENRRVLKKFDGKFSRTSLPIEDFDIHDKEFVSFCVEYFTKRHGPNLMPHDRVRTILDSGLITHVVRYAENEKPVAYVLEVSDQAMTHFWFSFYNLDYVHQSLGMWLMLDSARSAKERNAEHFYAGTVYGDKALYKTSFANIEFWDGGRWANDIKRLKLLGRTDGHRVVGLIDDWKSDKKLF